MASTSRPRPATPSATRSLALAALLAPVLAMAATPPDTELRCPASLVQAPVADGVPAGWVVHGLPQALLLQRAGFYDGDPVGLGPLAPESTHRDGLVETSTWRFEADQSARVWIGCLYRGDGAVVARPLPGGLRQCTTTMRLTSLGDPAGTLSVRCR